MPPAFVRTIQDHVLAQAEHALLKVLSAGPIPRHIAFVMDGNRRYARLNNKRVHDGHVDGFTALRRVLHICWRLNIKFVTVYAFSIENFKRPKDEVDALMDLAERKLLELCAHGDLFDEYGVRLNVFGHKELLPEAVQVAIKQAEAAHAERCISAVLNLCMPYTSRHEITVAVESTVREALHAHPDTQSYVIALYDDGRIFSALYLSHITEETIEKQLMTSKAGIPPLDIVVRTSGVKRLSDFMLWQSCEDTQLHFSPTYWPDFGLWDMVPIILDYQRKMWSKP